MNAAELLTECLEVEAVEYVFGIPGEETEDIMFALSDSEISFVPVRHEQGAAFMADVYGRLTGDAGVCLSTLGPGATNLITGVADAQLDKSPLVAITGQAGRQQLHKESHQALDIVEMLAPVTKWNTQITDPTIVNESVRKAFKTAEYEKPGATHLEFPEDVASEKTTDRPLERRERVRRPNPDPSSVERAVEILADADRPLVLAGNGAVRTRASSRLRELVDSTGMAVVSTYMGKGAISDRDPHSLMTLDSSPDGEGSQAVERADAVLAVGYDIAEHDPETWNPDLAKQIVHLDSEPAESYEQYNPEVEIIADVSAGLAALAEEIDVKSEPWCQDAHDAVIADVMDEPDSDEPFSVAGVLPHLRAAMDDEDTLVSDVGSHKMVIAQRFPTYEPNTTIISNGLASMGIGVPGGLAADLVTDGNVVVATGDGGFLMNAAEIETATRIGCGFTIIVFNDNDYGLISEQQEEHAGFHFGTELTNPDFVKFAESFGIEGYRPESWRAVESILEEAVPSDEMSLVEIPIRK